MISLRYHSNRNCLRRLLNHMRKLLHLFIILSCFNTVIADEVVDPPAPVPSIRLPLLPKDENPAPPEPVQVTKLYHDQWYVIESDIECMVLSSRKGIVSIDHDAKGVKLKGKFADGNNKIETREYKAEHIYTVSAILGGQVELLIVPKGAEDESVVIRRTLDVMGLSPQPPPGPTPPGPTPPGPTPPGPTPDVDPVPVPVTGFRVLFLTESESNLTRDQLNTLNSTSIAQWLNDNCVAVDGHPEWRKWDRSVVMTSGVPKESPIWQKLLNDIQPNMVPGPMMIIATDTKAVVHPLGNPADTLAALTKAKEGK